MTLAPLLDAPPLIRVHAVAAMSAFLLGLTQFALPKGTPRHRALGAVWIALMLAVCLTAFGIRTLNPGHFSFVHVIAAVTLVMLPIGILHARRHRVRAHAWAMAGMFFGALVIAGAFTLLPSRIMGRVFFG